MVHVKPNAVPKGGVVRKVAQNVPSGNEEEFKPLTVTETLQNVYTNYKDVR